MKDVVYKKKTRNRYEGCFCMAESWMWEEIIQRENFFKPGRNSKLRNNVARVTQKKGARESGVGSRAGEGRHPLTEPIGQIDCPTFDAGYLIKNLSRMCKYPIIFPYATGMNFMWD